MDSVEAIVVAILLALVACGDGGFFPPDAAVPAPDAAVPDARVDAEPPQIVFSFPVANQELSGIVIIRLAVTDDTGVVRVDLWVDDLPLATLLQEPYVAQWDSTGFPLGAYTLRALATDRAGRTGEAQVAINVVESTTDQPPVVTFVAPGDGTTVCGLVAIEVDATDDLGVERVELFVDGGWLATLVDAPYVQDWNTSGFELGPHGLKAAAYDTIGQVSERSVAVQLVSPGCAAATEAR